MYFHFLHFLYLSDRNLESLSVCPLLHYYQHLEEGQLKKSVRKNLSCEWEIFQEVVSETNKFRI